MNILHVYATEKLMELRQNEISRASRNAWIWNSIKKKNSVLQKFAGMFKKPAYTNNMPASDPCCNCCEAKIG